MATYCLYNIPHTYVYRRPLHLNSGVQYIWETRNLRGNNPDTYMYLVRGNRIVARNDDWGRQGTSPDDPNRFASLIAYVPTVTGSYYLIIRGYSKYSGGTCDVYQSVGGMPPNSISTNVKFGGYPVSAHWKADERIFTRQATGDTYLYLLHWNTMLRDDDSGEGLCSSINPGYESWGTVVVGSYSTYSEGRTALCNYYQSYLDNPGHKEEVDDPKIIISENMAKFQTELKNEKPSLEKLSPEEREERVLKLRDSILSKEDISQLGAPEIKAPREFITAYRRYQEILKVSEKKLARLSREKRVAEMAKLEYEKRDIFGDLVPQEGE